MSDEKKIIIDEDWKTQVQAEKDAASKHSAGAEVISPTGSQPDTARAEAADPPMPPASFEMLISSLASEALVALGQIPHPATGKAEMQRNHAQYLIDMLDVLRQKSKGNLTPDEQQLMDDILHQMRMVFIAVANQPAKA
jgi:hypothetical protein